ncbi:MAG: zinc ribbon domain-containing protein [Candidatus Aureabacteria bacterium]|nr:zinc ribbon domain-containing protein [Candidatus Auribacterota bacterium]
MSKERLEVTRGIKEGANGVDRQYEDKNSKGIIKGFAVMSKGNVKDMRGWVIDDKTLDQIVSAGKAHKKLGLKSRFGHPNMSDTALGTFLGRAKNFVKDGDIVRADLYLSKTAYSTPKGDLASYVLDLAEKDPEAFGTSVCLGEYELEDQIITKEQKDEGVTDLAPLLRVKTLETVDAVDSPAANNSMFGTFFNESVELSAKATEFLENLLSSPDALNKVISFLERFKVNKEELEKFNYKCEDCGAEVKPDKNLECPKCGGQMRRAGRPGPGQDGQQKNQEVNKMGIELKDVTLDQLKSERPELAAKLSEEAVSGERTRVLSIVKSGQKEFAGMGMESLTEKAIEEGQDLNTSLAAMRGKRLTDLEAEKNRVPGPDGDIPPKKDHFSRAKEYQEINKCTLSKALLDTADPR